MLPLMLLLLLYWGLVPQSFLGGETATSLVNLLTQVQITPLFGNTPWEV